ncbi:MAG: hypothetical protein AB7F86_08370 [Bdellovibrionales bacterium]
MSVWILPLLLTSVAHAENASNRASSIYGQLGLGKSYSTLSNTSAESSYSAWSGLIEAGSDLSFTSSGESGFTIGAFGRTGDLSNRGNGESFIESGTITGYGGKAGFYLAAFTLGGGVEKLKVKAKRLTTTSGYGETTLDGNTSFGFANLTFNIKRKYRSTIEVRYSTGKVGDLDYQELGVNLRIGIVEYFK